MVQRLQFANQLFFPVLQNYNLFSWHHVFDVPSVFLSHWGIQFRTHLMLQFSDSPISLQRPFLIPHADKSWFVLSYTRLLLMMSRLRIWSIWCKQLLKDTWTIFAFTFAWNHPCSSLMLSSRLLPYWLSSSVFVGVLRIENLDHLQSLNHLITYKLSTVFYAFLKCGLRNLVNH